MKNLESFSTEQKILSYKKTCIYISSGMLLNFCIVSQYINIITQQFGNGLIFCEIPLEPFQKGTTFKMQTHRLQSGVSLQRNSAYIVYDSRALQSLNQFRLQYTLPRIRSLKYIIICFGKIFALLMNCHFYRGFAGWGHEGMSRPPIFSNLRESWSKISQAARGLATVFSVTFFLLVTI